jgi:membrane protein DedA with SNARE-associated domain
MIVSFVTGVLSYLLLYKYVALFVIAYLAAFLIPLPSNTTLLAASAFAGQGYLNIYFIFFIALSANVAGDVTGFLLSRKYGKKVLMKTVLRKVILSEKYTDMEKVFSDNAGITIFTTRFFGGIGPLVNFVSGFSDSISFKKFLLYGVPGEMVYVSFFVISGYYVGDAWLDLLSPIESFWLIIGVIVLVVFSLKVYAKIRK